MQSPCPSVQVRAVSEFEGARSDLMTQLPAELPVKDHLHGLQPGVAAPEDVVAPMTEDQLVGYLGRLALGVHHQQGCTPGVGQNGPPFQVRPASMTNEYAPTWCSFRMHTTRTCLKQ